MKRMLVMLALCASLALPAQAGFEEGLAAYQRGDYATALKEWRPLAERGDARAQTNLANMYFQGLGVPQSDHEAAKWMRRAAEQGIAQAQCNLGFMYANGRGVQLDRALGYALCAVASVSDPSARQNRDAIFQRLNPYELREGEELKALLATPSTLGSVLAARDLMRKLGNAPIFNPPSRTFNEPRYDYYDCKRSEDFLPPFVTCESLFPR